MSDLSSLSETKRTLLHKFLQGTVGSTRSNGPSITRRPLGNVTPLSSGQRQMWLLHQLLPQAPVYTECATVRIPGLLDPGALERAFNEIIRRHEAWRTTFPLVDGQPMAVVHSPSYYALPVRDLRGLPAVQRKAEALRLVSKDIDEPFDPAQGPLLRPLLMRLEDNEHWLVLCLHHIIFDGVTLHQLFPMELRQVYMAFHAGEPSPLPDPSFQYGDFAVWQNAMVQAGALDPHLQYWRKQLDGSPPLLHLPTDRPRPALPTYRGDAQPFTLRPNLTAELKALCLAEGVTLYMLLLAALDVLLYRYTGQQDIAVGSAVSGRNRAETRQIMGFFVNMLVMRTNVLGELTFRELLARVREVVLGAVAHEDVPFDLLVKELAPDRDPSRNPLFQVALALVPTPVSATGWTVTQMDSTTHTAKFDLSLELEDHPEDTGLVGRIEYNTDLFDAVTIKRMADHWQALLESIVVDPGQRLWDLPMLAPSECRQLLTEWNDTAVPYPVDQCLHQLIEARVARNPDAPAVVFENTQLSYAELNRRANQLAHRLRALGVGPDTLVAICLERSLELMVGLLGILKAGGAYVPLDPAYPKERLAFMLSDSRAPVLLTQQSLLKDLPTDPDARLVLLDTDWPTIAREDTANPASITTAANLAYVIYTSGSTGRPKGAMNEHRGIVNRLCWMQDAYRLQPGETVLQKTPAGFDVSVWEFFWPLLAGARLVLARPEGHKDPMYLAEIIQQAAVTTLHFVPSMLREFLAAANLAHCEGVRRIICSGEALPADLAADCLNRLPGASLYNLYGPTEAAIDVSHWTCTVENVQSGVPIGRPVANTALYILDAGMHPVPIGVPGELYLGGIQVGRGYWQRPELTAERFVPNPFDTTAGGRLYRTGDRARWRPDGAVEYLGRVDFQVKLRGYRIELSEIEAVLLREAAVAEAVVVLREDRPGDQRLTAYIVPSGPALEPECLRMALRAVVPEYMVPTAFVTLTALPVTPNGKLDHRALPAPNLDVARDRSFTAPRTAVEQKLAAIWTEVVGVGKVGVDDNFFELGGHSLSAVQVLTRVRNGFGVEVALPHFFETPTVAGLAKAVGGMKEGLGAREQEPAIAAFARPVRRAHRDS